MTTEAAPAAADTSLSFEAAVGLLDATPAEAVREEDEATPETPELEAEPTADSETDPDEPAIDLEDEEATDADPELPVIDAPKSWAAEDRAVFATLPREAQQVIAARETERDKSTQKAVQEASEARKTAETTVQSVTQLKAATEQVLNKVAEIFHGKWDRVDWAAWAQSDPAAYVAGKAQFDAEQAELTRLEAVNQAQAQQAQRAFQAAKMEQIKTEAPDLVDPTKGRERVQKLEQFLEGNGISRDVFHTLDAFTIGLAYDGYRYRQAVARAKDKTQPPVTTRAAVRPTPPPAVPSPKRAADAAKNRFAQTGSFEDAVAVLTSRQ